MDRFSGETAASEHIAANQPRRQRRKKRHSILSTESPASTFKTRHLCTIIIAFIALANLPTFFSPTLFAIQPVDAIAELEDLLLLAMMQNMAAAGAAGGGGGNALTGAFSGLGRGLGCARTGARIQNSHDTGGPGSMPTNEVTLTTGGQQLHGGGSEGNARAISVDPNPAPLIKAGEETNSINPSQKMMINSNNAAQGGALTPFLDFEILPGFVINGSSSSGGGNGGGSAGGGSGFSRQQPMSSGQSVDPNASAVEGSAAAANSGAEIEQVVQVSATVNKNDTVSVITNDTSTVVDVVDASSTSAPVRKSTNKVSIKISAKPANLVQQPPAAAASEDKNKLTSMFGWDQQQDGQQQAGTRRRKRSIQPVYEGQAREGRRGEPSFQRGSKRHQTPGVVSNIGPSTANLRRTSGRLIESRLETLVDKISAMNSAGGGGGVGNGGQMNMPFNPPPIGAGGGGGTLGGYLHPEGFGIPAPQYYGPNAAAGAGEQASRVYPPGFVRNPFDSPAANQAPWPDSQVAYVQPGQYQTSPQSAQQVLNNFLRFLPRLLEAAKK